MQKSVKLFSLLGWLLAITVLRAGWCTDDKLVNQSATATFSQLPHWLHSQARKGAGLALSSCPPQSFRAPSTSWGPGPHSGDVQSSLQLLWLPGFCSPTALGSGGQALHLTRLAEGKGVRVTFLLSPVISEYLFHRLFPSKSKQPI